MKRSITPSSRRLACALALLLLVPVFLLSMHGCTDLEERTFGVVTPDQFFQTEGEFLAAIAPVYASLRDMSSWDFWNINQHASDETLVPTRGGDWDDGGQWRELHRHGWTSTNPLLNSAWGALFTGVARATSVLGNLENAPEDLPNRDLFEAETRTLRAFFYWGLMDAFGNVPIVTELPIDPDNPPSNASRAEVFDFIVQELTESLPNLPLQQTGADYGRVTQGAARALLATLYLNAEVYTGELTGSGLQRGQPMWQEAADIALDIIDSGVYDLAPSFFENFTVDNHASPENIFVVQHMPRDPLGYPRHMATLHYNQAYQATPWNGFSTMAHVYESFDEEDERRRIFLEGQQYDQPRAGCIGSDCFSEGEPLTDRSGNPLVFTAEIPDLRQATEAQGVRVIKWEIDPDMANWESGTDFAFFRYAEILLIRAEALNELGRTPEAIELVNEVRERAFDPPQPLDVGMPQGEAREAILEERLFELTWENKRRTDLIRHDRFLDEWTHKPQSAPHRVVFPIPQAQLDANPNLTQNPGY